MKKAILLAAAVACTPCVDWTRFTGFVKKVDRSHAAVTIGLLKKGGDLITIPVDYQVEIYQGKEKVRDIKDLVLDEKITLQRVLSEPPPPDDTTGMALPPAR